MVPTSYYLVLSAVLFGLGVVAFIFKRNIITIFMSIELMLNAVNLAFVAFSRALGQLQGQVFVFFVIVVAAAEAAVGLAIIIVIHRNRQNAQRGTCGFAKDLMPSPLYISGSFRCCRSLGAAANGIFGGRWPKSVITAVALSSTTLAFLAALEAGPRILSPALRHRFLWIDLVFHLDFRGRLPRGFRAAGGPAHGHHAAGGYRRGLADSHLFHRLHARRSAATGAFSRT